MAGILDTRSEPFAGTAHLRRVPLAEAIADSIAQAIASGRLQAGERVVETELAMQLGVSRVPIREALKVLHAQGIVAGMSHRGYRIAAMGPDTVRQVTETRLALETFLLRDALANWSAGLEDPAALDLALAEMEAAARRGDARASLAADLDFHRAIRRASRNEIAGPLWEAIARRVLIVFGQDGHHDASLAAVVRHHKAYRATILGMIGEPADMAAVHAVVAAHLDRPRGRSQSSSAASARAQPRGR